MLSLHHALLKSYHPGRSLHRSAEVGCGGDKDNNRSHFRFTATDPGASAAVSPAFPSSGLSPGVRLSSSPTSGAPPILTLAPHLVSYSSSCKRTSPAPHPASARFLICRDPACPPARGSCRDPLASRARARIPHLDRMAPQQLLLSCIVHSLSLGALPSTHMTLPQHPRLLFFFPWPAVCPRLSPPSLNPL